MIPLVNADRLIVQHPFSSLREGTKRYADTQMFVHHGGEIPLKPSVTQSLQRFLIRKHQAERQGDRDAGDLPSSGRLLQARSLSPAHVWDSIGIDRAADICGNLNMGQSDKEDGWMADSVRRKRKKKMNKHKHAKRRKLNRHRK